VIPNYAGKYNAPALYDPEQAVVRGEDGLPDLPPAVVLGFRETLRAAVQSRAEPIDPHPDRELSYYRLSASAAFCPVEAVGVGAPVAAIAAEKAIAAGAETVVVLAGCGAVQPDTPADAVLLPTRAIRDEGASYHYVPGDETVRATPLLVEELADAFAAAGTETDRGPTWTTSALFRETIPEADHYRERGVVSVDMESAAVWAVCRYRGVEAATVHHVDDYLASDTHVDHEAREAMLADRLDPTVAALDAHVDL
jgi:uridine phosphorylase